MVLIVWTVSAVSTAVVSRAARGFGKRATKVLYKGTDLDSTTQYLGNSRSRRMYIIDIQYRSIYHIVVSRFSAYRRV